jgi:hypothetical protein
VSNLRLPSDQTLARAWPLIDADLTRRIRPAATSRRPGAVHRKSGILALELALLRIGGATLIRCEFPAKIIANASALCGGQFRAEPKGEAWIIERVG